MELELVKIGKRLEQVRILLGMKQEEFADTIETSRSALNTYLRGDRMLPISCLLALNFKHKIDPVWLIEGDQKNGLTSMEDAFFERTEHIEDFLDDQLTSRKLTLEKTARRKAIRHLYKATKLAVLCREDAHATLERETGTIINLMAV